MAQFKLICDSACDLSKEMVKENDIDVISFYVSLDNQNYYKEQEKDTREFYQTLVDYPDIYPKTSMPTSEDYFVTFEKYVKENIPVICICLSSKMSGSYNGAMIAKKDILEKYPNSKIEVVDSILITGLEGMLALEVSRMNKNNVSFEDALVHIERIKKTGRVYFTIGSLDYLAHGGRIGKLKSILGSVLKIKPIIVFKNGEIDTAGMSLTRSKSLTKVIDSLKNYFKKHMLNMADYIFGIGFGYRKDEFEEFGKRVKEELSLKNLLHFQIGSTIAVHTGPHPIGITFLKKYDVL